MYAFLHNYNSLAGRKISAIFKFLSTSLTLLFALALTTPATTCLADPGQLDPAFGNAGILNITGRTIDAIAKQPDGKLLLGRGEFVNIVQPTTFSLMRYNLNGTVDNTFGNNGEVITDFNGGTNSITSIAVQANGKIVAAGRRLGSNTASLVIARYNPDGSLDNSLNGNGRIVLDNFTIGIDMYSVFVQTDGKIVASSNVGVVRFNVDGTIDTSFGTAGRFSFISTDHISSIAVQSDNKIIAVGQNQNSRYVVERFNTNGTLDNSFDGDGLVMTDFEPGDRAVSVTIVADGTILVSGATSPDRTGFFFAHYRANGSLDTDQGGTGKLLSTRGPAMYNSIAVEDDGKFVIAGGTADFNAVRLRGTDLNPDTSFNHGGFLSMPENIDRTFGAVISGNDLFIVGTSYYSNTSIIAAISLVPSALSGLNYKYYEGSYSALPNFNTLTPLKMGVTANVDLSVRNAGVNSNYAILWEGNITLPTAGTYTFETVSDDGSKLYFNTTYSAGATALVNNDGLHGATSATGSVTMAAGTYPIAISFFQAADNQTMQVYWSGPGIARQLIPGTAFTPSSSIAGINYKYYEGAFTTLPNFNALTPVRTGISDNIDISRRTQNVDDNFAFLWEGYITLPTSGQYTFETVSDDGSKLYFNTTYSAGTAALVNNDGLHAPTSATGTVNVSAGTYPIAITYFEATGGQSMQVYWTGPGIARQLIPNSALSFTAPSPTVPDGLNYKYYQGAFTTLPNFSALTPVKTGTTVNTDITIRPAGVNDNFAFLWEGYIKLPTAGVYTFETVSDDGSKLYFNTTYSVGGTPLVNNDGLHAPTSASGSTGNMAAGTYPIAISFFEATGGESMQVYWSGPGIARQLVPNSAFTLNGNPPPPAATGLNYKYYEGSYTTLPNFNALSPVKTGTTANTDISVRRDGVNDNFAFMWQGYINLPTAGTYIFETVSDDGSKLYFNTTYAPGATALVNNDGIHAPTSATGSVTVAAGTYPIAITFFEATGGETMQVYWTGPGITRQLIPNSAFTLTSGAVAPVAMDQSGLQASGSLETVGIKQVYPNPFSESFVINFDNPVATNDINIGVYDLNGKEVFVNRLGKLPVGDNIIKMNLNGVNIGNGIYIVQVKKNGIAWKTMKVIKMKR